MGLVNIAHRTGCGASPGCSLEIKEGQKNQTKTGGGSRAWPTVRWMKNVNCTRGGAHSHPSSMPRFVC